MREYILTKLVCTACGGNLATSNDKPKSSKHAEGEPTGASCAHVNIFVHPCSCTLKAQRDLNTLRNLLNTKGDL